MYLHLRKNSEVKEVAYVLNKGEKMAKKHRLKKVNLNKKIIMKRKINKIKY